MKRSYVILIAGAVIFIAGIAIFQVYTNLYVDPFLNENTIVSNSTIQPGQSINISRETVEAGRNFSLVVSSESSDGMLAAETSDPEGIIISSNKFSEQLFTTFKPEITGKYTSKITNLGTKPVTINAVVGQLPIIDENDRAQLDILNGILAGVFAIIIGIIVLIAGCIILIKDRIKSKATRIGEGIVDNKKNERKEGREEKRR
jgi:hypothetical protein